MRTHVQVQIQTQVMVQLCMYMCLALFEGVQCVSITLADFKFALCPLIPRVSPDVTPRDQVLRKPKVSAHLGNTLIYLGKGKTLEKKYLISDV